MFQQKSYQTQFSGTLYLVPTPIGNLDDMTLRSCKLLKECDLIASEDTRNTQKLLNHIDSQVPQMSLHEHNYRERVPQLIKLLKEGKMIAQVSDAGMPSISDPGHELVVACIQEQIPVVAIPGPTAGLTALIASGLTPQPHYFYGFLPRKKKKQVEELQKLADQVATLIFYESPYRVAATLEAMRMVFGGERQAVICRELTKIHEEYIRGSIDELWEYLQQTVLKGECCLLVAGKLEEEPILAEYSLEDGLEMIATRVSAGTKATKAIKEVAKETGLSRQELYSAYHQEE